MPRTTFYFDLGSPFAYLAAERLGELLPEPVGWEPVLLGGLFKLNGRSSWARGDAGGRAAGHSGRTDAAEAQRRSAPGSRRAGMAEVERRAREYGLPALLWPERWPTDYLFAMRVATFAFQVSRGREFALRAFRAAFAEGRDLGVPGHVLDVAAAVGIDRQAAEEAADDPAVKGALRAATDAAHGRGVFGVPTVAVGERLFWGDDRLREAAAA